MSAPNELRAGEVALPFDPARQADAMLAYVGRIRSPWTDRATCPHNLREARARGGGGSIEIAEPYRPALRGLAAGSPIVLVYWLHQARRDIVVAHPRHADGPRGVFSLRAPVRPNPIGLATVKLLSVDERAGLLKIDAIDCLDGTPLIDVKSYRPQVDEAERL